MKIPIFSLFIAVGLALSACSKSDVEPKDNEQPVPEQPETPNEDDNNQGEIPTTTYGLTQLDFCLLFENEPSETILEQQAERELSGVAASCQNPGLLYMHGDSKNSAILISDAAGKNLGKIILDGVATVDPEDIAVGPGPGEGKSYIYFADIGDNDKKRGSITVYRFEEPILDLKEIGAQTEVHVKDATKLVLNYPGSKYNAETLLLDPLTKDFYIVTKETLKAKVFRAAYPQAGSNALEQVLNMRSFDLFTAGDISADGTEILLRNKGQIWYWERDPKTSIVETLLEAPQKSPYAGNERQGEGIGFAVDGRGYFTNSEVKDEPGTANKLSFYGRK